MRERHGNIWRLVGIADAICVTTNAIVKSNGALTMGAGIAKEAVMHFPGIQFNLGKAVQQFGNIPVIGTVKEGTRIVSFPTKNDWKDPSDMFLIKRSAEALVDMANRFNWKYIALPRLGCGLGGLQWEDVSKILSPLFDDRFVICSK